MTFTVTRDKVAAALLAAIPRLATQLPTDVYAALREADEVESSPRGKVVLGHLLANAHVACADGMPICQDTGTVWASLEVGPDVAVAGDVFADADAAVAETYGRARLRKSLVHNAVFDRSNTGDNTPAFVDIHPVDEPGVARLRVMLKGGGSDNASRVVMLTPGAGRVAIVEEVVKCVREKAANACPPLVIGIGVGTTFDKVGTLAKRALMRRIDEPASDEAIAAFERELLEAVNATGVGPGGLGGARVALAVRVATAPCHIAALPLAINMGCSAMRRATIDLAPDAASVDAQLDGQLVSFAGADGAEAPSETPRFASSPAAQALRSCPEAEEGSGQGASEGASAASGPIRLTLPLDRAAAAQLRAGDACLLTGTMYTLRDAGHVRLLDELQERGGKLPYGLDGQTIFYAGPTPEVDDRPFGAVGPTTSSRMDFAAAVLHDAGVVATIGKGRRSAAVREACVRNGCVYFTATGGAAALLAKQVRSSDLVAYDDLGTEALRRIEVVDFPVFVGIDTEGTDVYDLV